MSKNWTEFSLDVSASLFMTLSYTDSQTGRRLDDKSVDYTRKEALSLVRDLRHPDASLISTLPCGAGLDFLVHDDGTIWIEFYADDGLHSATVSLAAAEEIFVRAFSLEHMADTKATFGDLIREWDY